MDPYLIKYIVGEIMEFPFFVVFSDMLVIFYLWIKIQLGRVKCGLWTKMHSSQARI